MNPIVVKKAALYLVGGVAGGIVGYFVGSLIVYQLNKREEEIKQNMEEYEEEINQANYVSPNGDKPVDTNSEDVINIRKEVVKVDYSKIASSSASNLEKPKLSELVSLSRQKTPTERKEGPYIISLEEYAHEKRAYSKETLTYYEEDDTLINEDEHIIPDPEKTLGDALLNFGQESEDPDIVYVRNDNISTDYEVIRKEGSYQSAVLGVPEKRSKKNRSKAKSKNGENSEE